MAVVSHTESIGAAADAVWAVIGDFANAAWIPFPVRCEGSGPGATRTVSMPFGEVVERCESCDPDRRVIAYSIVRGNPLAVSGFVGTIAVVAADPGHSRLTWTATYEPVDEPAASAAFLERLLPASAAAVKHHLEGGAGQ